MSPSRRRTLELTGAVVVPSPLLAGCLSRPFSSADAASPDTTPPDAADCPDGPRVPEAERHGDEVPPEVPSPPASLTEADVLEYVGRYERAYQWRRFSTRGEPLEFHLDGNPEAVWAGDGGVHAAFDDVFPHGRYRDEDGEEYYVDGLGSSVSYLVTDRAVWRAESERTDDPPDAPAPRADGELLECY